MGIQSTERITRAHAERLYIESQLDKMRPTFKKIATCLTNKELEDEIEEHFYFSNYQIVTPED